MIPERATILRDAETVSGTLLRQLKQLERIDGNDWLKAQVLVNRVRGYIRAQREIDRRQEAKT